MQPFKIPKSAVIFLGAVIALVQACGGRNTGDLHKLDLAGFSVSMAAEPFALQVSDQQGLLLFDLLPASAEAPYGGLAIRQAQASFEMQVGSFRIIETQAESWQKVTRLGKLSRTEGQIQFELLNDAGQQIGNGHIRAAEEGHLELRFEAQGPENNRVSIAFSADEHEHFMGFGGQSFDVDHRGQTVPIWVQEDGITKNETDEYGPLWFVNGGRHSTHTPMPIFISSRGYGLALNSDYRSLFHMASEDPAAIRIEAWHHTAELHLFAGPSPARIVEGLTAWTGRPDDPPDFTFAPWLDAMYGSDNVRRVAERLRAEDVPCSAIWTEDWRGAIAGNETYILEEDWNVDRELYPDFEAVADDLHGWGYKFLTYNNTFMMSSADIWDEAMAQGYAIGDGQGGSYIFTGATFEDTSLLDMSNPAAWDWAKEIYGAGLELGADGYMADFAEWLPTDAHLASGESAFSYHNRYPVEYQRLNKELLDEMYAQDGVDRLFFVRSAYLGSQDLVSVVWAGDQQTDFSLGDGMPSVIPMGIGLGLTGFPYFGHDIGGYMSSQTEPTSKELWFRWVTLGALSPVMRTHHGRSSLANWNWESDQSSVDHLRRWAKVHIQLFPYFKGLVTQVSQHGYPIFRPLAFDFPEFEPGWTLTDQFMLGDRILVAPVIEQGATARTIQFPPGTWYPLLGGPALEVGPDDGGQQVDCAPNEIPAYVPAGCMLVLLPPDIDTLAPASDEQLITLDQVGDDRELWLWPGGQSQWSEGQGLEYDWQAQSLSGPIQTASWNGTPVSVVEESISVQGQGTLVVNNQAQLTISGGAAQRQVLIRFP